MGSVSIGFFSSLYRENHHFFGFDRHPRHLSHIALAGWEFRGPKQGLKECTTFLKARSVLLLFMCALKALYFTLSVYKAILLYQARVLYYYREHRGLGVFFKKKQQQQEQHTVDRDAFGENQRQTEKVPSGLVEKYIWFGSNSTRLLFNQKFYFETTFTKQHLLSFQTWLHNRKDKNAQSTKLLPPSAPVLQLSLLAHKQTCKNASSSSP